MIAAPTRRSRRANARARRRGQSPWTGATARHLRVAQDAAGLTTSTYDGDNLRRKIVSGSVTTTFVWDGADYLQIKPSSGDATLLVVLDGEVVGHVKGSEKRDYIVDPLGSVVAYLNSSQTLTDQFEYWPYGEMVAEIEAGTEPFLWVGSLGYFRENDLRTYIRARTYRQDLGSWMQLDPLWPNELPQQYCGDSPVSSKDPSGLVGIYACAGACIGMAGCAHGIWIACQNWQGAYGSFIECAQEFIGDLPPISQWGCGIATGGCLYCLARLLPKVPLPRPLPGGPRTLPGGPRPIPGGPRTLPGGPRPLPGGPRPRLGPPGPSPGPSDSLPSPASGPIGCKAAACGTLCTAFCLYVEVFVKPPPPSVGDAMECISWCYPACLYDRPLVPYTL